MKWPFSRKPNAELENLRDDNRALRNQIEYLVRTIRDMDQEIWNMAQRTDWPSMRNHFVKLQEGMIARKHAENERISSIMTKELAETYVPRTKELEHKR